MAYNVVVVSKSLSVLKEGEEPLLGCSEGMLLISDGKPVSSAVFKLSCENATIPMCSITPYGLFTAILGSNETVEVTIECLIDGVSVFSVTDTVADICNYTVGSNVSSDGDDSTT